MEKADIIFDDIGSFPCPKGTNVQNLSKEDYIALVKDVMGQKIAAGVEVPTYPQMRDMIHMFTDIIQDPNSSESPYVVKEDFAKIIELDAIEGMRAQNDRTEIRTRICVTGPIELYLSQFPSTNYTDILYALAKSVARFVENSFKHGFDVSVVSLDEPSLGISSNINFSEEEMQEALDIASKPCKGKICEVHLHSPLMVETCCRVPFINVIGVESAAHPDYLKLVDKSILKENDSYLRAGIARTDILSMVARLNDKLEKNLWKEPELLNQEILAMESPDTIRRRLESVVREFGDRVRCAGPDCGLGSWPSQELARRLLENCAIAINSFKKG